MSYAHRFTDKIAFVTGAASGIGRATAVAFAAEGARVAILDRTGAHCATPPMPSAAQAVKC